MRTGWTLVSLRLACVVFVAGVVGCGTGNEATTDRSDATETPKPQVPSDEAQVALVAVPNAEIPADDPSQQGWETEAFSSRVDKQLKQFKELIETAPTVRPQFVADAFSGDRLRPAQLETVYETQLLTVRRWQPRGGEGPTDRESQEFLPALRSLVSHVGDLKEVRTKVKVFGVELREQAATTELYFQLFGRHATGTLQVNSTWRCEWSTEDPLQLRSIELLDYEEVVTASGAKPVFADRTYAVLDGPAFQQQLKYGVDHWLNRVELGRGIDIGGWQGLAIADVNNDGLDDVYICQPGGLPNRLYLQNADGTATETSQAAGVDWLESSHAALFVDLDNDRDQDLIVGLESGVLILSNDGRGYFAPRASMVLPAALPYSIAAADVDVDGDLDAYVCCYNRRRGVNRHLLFATSPLSRCEQWRSQCVIDQQCDTTDWFLGFRIRYGPIRLG